MTGTVTARSGTAGDPAAEEEPPHSLDDALRVLPPAPGERPEPTWHHATVLAHRAAGGRHRFLRLHAPSVARTARPGQFVMITVARPGEQGPVLPRPMAVYRRDPAAGTLDVVYGVVGEGTRRLASRRVRERLLVVGPLGQGFRVRRTTSRVLLVGRGIGTCSLTTVAQDLAGTGTEVVAVTSARNADSLVGEDLYRALGAHAVHAVTDADGSSGVPVLRARLLAALDATPPHQIMTCGSRRLTRLCRELGARWGAEVQVSLEAHMACGVGYCHGCATGTRGGPEESPLICRDGPVFRLHHTAGEAGTGTHQGRDRAR
jgi:dihydroorotate dehydrogenase electron transfer subunit